VAQVRLDTAVRKNVTTTRGEIAMSDFWKDYEPEPHKGLSDNLAQATNGRVHVDPVTGDVGIGTPAAPDLQAELDATNRQVEILSDALAESRREVDAMIALARADEREKAKHNEEVLMNALWKACGDDGQLVEETIESQGELK
jgi:hypothetical protein